MIEFVQNNLLLVILTVTSGTMLLLSVFSPGGQAISPGDATLLINRENGLMVDVRSPVEYADGHVADSINVPRDKIAERVKELEKYKDRPLILNCASGARSGSACAELKRLGFARVYNLSGGVGAWAQAGLPLKKGNK